MRENVYLEFMWIFFFRKGSIFWELWNGMKEWWKGRRKERKKKGKEKGEENEEVLFLFCFFLVKWFLLFFIFVR